MTTSNNQNKPLFNPQDTNLANEPKIASHDQVPSDDGKLKTNLSEQNLDNVRDQIGHLELLEERAVVNKERLDVGKITVSKQQRSKTVQVPVELVEEVLTIQTRYEDGNSQAILANHNEDDLLQHVEPKLHTTAVVKVNGKQIEVGEEPVEIVLSRQVATITKETYAVQEIDIEKSLHTHTDSIAVELQYEELDVHEEGFLDRKNP